MHNFTVILADPKPVKLPGQLAYDIPDQPATTHDLLLQKGNGRYMLAIWGERFGSGGADRITIRFGKKMQQLNVYDPTTGTEPLQTYRKIISLDLEVNDHPVIIEIKI
jgi:hypothetical protein